MSRKILAFGASNSRNSINKKLATYAASLFRDASVEVLDLNDFEVTLFSVDKEAVIPEAIYKFAQKIDEADLILVSLAEHNGNYSAAFKNIFDWVSRIPERKVFAHKKMFLLATSPGARGGSTVLEIAKNRFPFDGGKVLGVFSLPNFYKNFEDQKGITNSEFKNQLIEAIQNI